MQEEGRPEPLVVSAAPAAAEEDEEAMMRASMGISGFGGMAPGALRAEKERARVLALAPGGRVGMAKLEGAIQRPSEVGPAPRRHPPPPRHRGPTHFAACFRFAIQTTSYDMASTTRYQVLSTSNTFRTLIS